MLRYLLDTNIISELARLNPDPQVCERVLARQQLCAISASTVEELYFGVGRLPAGSRKQMLERWLGGVLASYTILPYGDACARWLGMERARLMACGKTVSRADGEIASVAVVSGLTLVTRNVTDFQYFEGLEVQNWFL